MVIHEPQPARLRITGGPPTINGRVELDGVDISNAVVAITLTADVHDGAFRATITLAPLPVEIDAEVLAVVERYQSVIDTPAFGDTWASSQPVVAVSRA